MASKFAESIQSFLFKKECIICMERHEYSSFISATGCNHKYCTDCTKRYFEMTFQVGYSHIKCPHEKCEQNYSSRQCRALLSESDNVILKNRQEEEATPPRLRFYCPHKECSAFMRKPESGTSFQCVSCQQQVCLECNVPWHEGQTCAEYRAEEEEEKLRVCGDQELRDLVKQKQWQICGRCKRIVERTSGCSHMVCLCRNHFCYTCGANWTTRCRH